MTSLQIQYFSSNHPADGSIPRVCRDEGSILRTELLKFPHPNKWTFIITCDESSWTAVERHVDWINVPGQVLGLTDIDHGLTYLRGDTLLRPLNESPGAQPEHVIAHELGHIYLHSHNEQKVEALTQEWLRSIPAYILTNSQETTNVR